MEKKYVLGVDGGNTKTHYFLYDTEGNYVDCVCAGTCSHEALPDSFDGTYREIGQRMAELFSRNGISVEDIAFAAFGLAGADFEWQKEKLSSVIRSLGFNAYVVDNDGFLALKAGCESGFGVGCINGTGTVTVGINEKGERLQIGGMGEISSDKAGASYIASRGMSAVYDMIFRGGEKTVLKEMFFEESDIILAKDFSYAAASALRSKQGVYKINLLMERAEAAGDGAVKKISEQVGRELAISVAGCIENLRFLQPVEVVLAGSVWVKGKFPSMNEAFVSILQEKSPNPFMIRKLEQPPAIGAVIWALEEYRGQSGDGSRRFDKTTLLKNERLLEMF